MKDLSASAAGEAPVAIERCYAHLSDVERYPQWYPSGARSVTVRERGEDGAARLVDAVLAVTAGPLRREFAMRLAVERDPPSRVAVVRVADGRGDHELLEISWSLASVAQAQTQVTVQLRGRLDVPMLVPADAVAREVAGGFLQAALRSL
jgi:ribosome-associated toxin RatA of RatAB toxin-antitoxin module